MGEHNNNGNSIFTFKNDSTTFKLVDAAKVNNIASLALVICVVIASVLSMGEVKLTFAEAVSVSTLCIILFIVSSLIYKTKYAEYEAKAKQNAEYIEVQNEYDSLVKKIQEKGLLARLPELCQRYIDLELKQFRTAILSNACIPYEVYERDYMRLSDAELKTLEITDAMRKAIKKANRAKGLHLTAQGLLSVSKQSVIRYSALTVSSHQREQIDSALNTLSRIVTTFLGGAVAVEVIVNFSWQAVAQWVLRMLPLAFAAFSGANQGTRNIMNTAIPHKRKQINIIVTILEWEKDYAPATVTADAAAE